MSKRTETDTPTEPHVAVEGSKKPRLDLHDQIQRAGILATQWRQAASKKHLSSTEWTANQAAANELLQTMESMQEKVTSTVESLEGLITAQIKLEVKLRMDALGAKLGKDYPLHYEIQAYLGPTQSDSRERIAKIALEKIEGVASADLAARVTKSVEAAILEVFHKGIDNTLRIYMK